MVAYLDRFFAAYNGLNKAEIRQIARNSIVGALQHLSMKVYAETGGAVYVPMGPSSSHSRAALVATQAS